MDGIQSTKTYLRHVSRRTWQLLDGWEGQMWFRMTYGSLLDPAQNCLKHLTEQRCVIKAYEPTCILDLHERSCGKDCRCTRQLYKRHNQSFDLWRRSAAQYRPGCMMASDTREGQLHPWLCLKPFWNHSRHFQVHLSVRVTEYIHHVPMQLWLVVAER